MLPCRLRGHATARRTHQKTLLNEEWFIDIFNTLFGLTHTDGQGGKTNWPAAEFAANTGKDGAVNFV